MIRSVPYSRLELPELLTLSDQSYQVVTERHPEAAILASALNPLSDAMDETRLALGSTTKEELTEQVEIADARRDDSYKALVAYIKAGLLRHSQLSYQEASKRLLAIINQNGGRSLYRYGYSKQTAALESLFKDLNSAEALKDLATIQATKWLDDLKADHEAFKTVYAQREKVRANKSKNIPTDDSARRKLQPALENLYTLVDAFFISAQIEGLKETIDILNKTIDRALASAR